MPAKTRLRMTYYVSSGTLNPTHSLTHLLLLLLHCYYCGCLSACRAGVMMQPRYAASTPAQQQQQSSAVVTGYQYYTPVYSQYPSVAVPPPQATWLQPAPTAAAPTVTPGIANHYVMPQQIQPAVCCRVFLSLSYRVSNTPGNPGNLLEIDSPNIN